MKRGSLHATLTSVDPPRELPSLLVRQIFDIPEVPVLKRHGVVITHQVFALRQRGFHARP